MENPQSSFTQLAMDLQLCHYTVHQKVSEQRI